MIIISDKITKKIKEMKGIRFHNEIDKKIKNDNYGLDCFNFNKKNYNFFKDNNDVIFILSKKLIEKENLFNLEQELITLNDKEKLSDLIMFDLDNIPCGIQTKLV